MVVDIVQELKQQNSNLVYGKDVYYNPFCFIIVYAHHFHILGWERCSDVTQHFTTVLCSDLAGTSWGSSEVLFQHCLSVEGVSFLSFWFYAFQFLALCSPKENAPCGLIVCIKERLVKSQLAAAVCSSEAQAVSADSWSLSLISESVKSRIDSPVLPCHGFMVHPRRSVLLCLISFIT